MIRDAFVLPVPQASQPTYLSRVGSRLTTAAFSIQRVLPETD